jgi:nitrite reductase/ring-hydroxylating ferredoxin subunit
MKEQRSVKKNNDIIRSVCVSNGENMSGSQELIAVCNTDEVAEGQAVKVETQGLVLAVFQVEGDFYVTDDTCTHGPGSLSEGCILGDMVECNFHNGAFNIRTGEVMEPPCMTPLKTYPVSVRGQQIFIKAV